MDIMIHALDIAGSEWFIIILTIIIVLVPSKISSISKTIGRFIGEFEKTKNNLIEEKNNLINEQSINSRKYHGPAIQRPISSEREKLEIIAKSLNLDTENKTDEELRTLISAHLK